MRIITIMLGTLFSAVGIYLVANGGLTFSSVAFIVGLVFTVGGIVECLSYGSYRGQKTTNSWILVDGTSTFMLGVLILLNKLSAEGVAPMVLGLWILYSGIRNFVHAWEQIELHEKGFLDHLLIGLVNIVLGLYAFFDQDLLNLSSITLVGIYMLAGGLNIMHVGATIVIRKPEFLKTKEERLAEAAAKREEAHEAAVEAIRVFKETRAALKLIEETPKEVLDPTEAPRPGSPEALALAEKAQNDAASEA